MRTLKRTLCLVLALVMVPGLGVNAFAFDRTADDFRDKDDARAVFSALAATAASIFALSSLKSDILNGSLPTHWFSPRFSVLFADIVQTLLSLVIRLSILLTLPPP